MIGNYASADHYGFNAPRLLEELRACTAKSAVWRTAVPKSRIPFKGCHLLRRSCDQPEHDSQHGEPFNQLSD